VSAPQGQQGSGAMFDAIAPRYDLLNRLMSLGVDQGWRRRTVDAIAPAVEAGGAILDLATGTADLAIAMARRWPASAVVGLDPSPRMLEIGRKKAQNRVQLVEGDARRLPFGDASFAAVTMAFGIRNVPGDQRVVALREMARVVRPGGRVAILELSEPRGKLLGRLARFHVHTLVPRLGALLSGAREYRYLERSIAAFPPPEAFADLMRAAGLRVVAVQPLTFGVCCLYVAEVV